MSTPPKPTINLDDISDFLEGIQDSPVPANTGNFQQWMEEPQKIVSYTSTASCSNGLTAPSTYSLPTSNVYSSGSSGGTGFLPNPNHEFQAITQPSGGYNAIVRPGWVNNTPKVTNNRKKHKRYRTAFTEQQLTALRQQYAKDRYLDREPRNFLAMTLKLKPQTIKLWFQNRRMKEKRDRLENEMSSDTSQVNHFNEDYSFVPMGVEGQNNPGLYAESYSLPVIQPSNPMLLPALPPMMPPVQPEKLPQEQLQIPPQAQCQILSPMQEMPYLANNTWDMSFIQSLNMD